MSFISDFVSGFKDYVTQTWKNRPSTETPMSAERLNHIEAGIKSISDAIKNMASAVSKDLANMTIGASNWDAAEGEPGYVQNRTHWKEYVSKQETILEETSVSFNNEMSSLYGLGTEKVISGKPYIVYWNGAKYECTAFEASYSVFLGNGSLSGEGDDTGEPFCMEMLTATSAFVMKSNSNTETIKIKVETPEVVKYHTIDPNFIPPGNSGGVTSWNDLTDKPFYEEVVEGYILPETTLTGTDGQMIITNEFHLQDGQTYTVKWNGTEYTCACIEEEVGLYGLGNLGAMMGGESTGEPFVIMNGESLGLGDAGYGVAVALDGSSTATVSIYGKKVTIYTLEEKYLSEIPVLDLVALGMDNLSLETKVTVSCEDFIVFKSAMKKGVIRVTANSDRGEIDTTGFIGIDGDNYNVSVLYAGELNLYVLHIIGSVQSSEVSAIIRTFSFI